MTAETRTKLLSMWEAKPETRPTMTHDGFVMCGLCVRTPDQFHWDTGEPSHITFVRDEQAESLAVARLVEWLTGRARYELSIGWGQIGDAKCYSVTTGGKYSNGPTLLDALIAAASESA